MNQDKTPEQLEALQSRRKELFGLWRKHEITQRLFKVLREERERMVDAVIYDQVEYPDNVKGRIAAIDNLLLIDMESLYND